MWGWMVRPEEKPSGRTVDPTHMGMDGGWPDKRKTRQQLASHIWGWMAKLGEGISRRLVPHMHGMDGLQEVILQ